MAIRAGIRGVTLDDVANVANAGSSAMRGGYTFSRPSRTTAPAFDVQSLIRGMTAVPLATAGERYSGYPTASAQEQAILGSIVPFYAIGDMARRLAEQQNERLLGESLGQLQLNEGTAASRALGDIRRVLGGSTAEGDAVAAAKENLAQTLARNALYGQATEAIGRAGRLSDKPEYWAAEARGEATPGQREEAILARRNLPEGVNFMQRAASEAMARQALRDASYADAMARRNAVAFAGTEPVEIVDPTTGQLRTVMATLGNQPAPTMRDIAISQATPGVRQQYETAFAEQVAPQLTLAEQISEVPRYQLAQQMATQYFGMDPALAAGMFTPQVDVDYMEMQRALQKEQQLAQGINPEATVADTLLAIDPTGARLAEYQQARALEQERALIEGSNTQAEDEMDANIEVATGIRVDQAAGDFSRATARQYLTDPTFMDAVQSSISDLQTTQLPLGMEPKDRIAQITSAYASQYADPVGAVILANILGSFSAIIPPSGQ